MRRLIPLVCALCLVAAWVAPGAAYDHVRFMGRDFPRLGRSLGADAVGALRGFTPLASVWYPQLVPTGA